MSAPVVEYIVPPVVEYYIDPSIVVENEYPLYLLFKYDFNENSNLSFCFIQYKNGQYYLCIYDEIEDLSYYIRYEIDLKNIITFYYNQIKINIQIDIPIFSDDRGNYITVQQFWAFPYVQSFNYTGPSHTGNYFIYYPAREMFSAREMSPVIFDARTESPVISDAKTESYIPSATAVIQKKIPVATVVKTIDNVLCKIEEGANPYDAKTYENHILIILNGGENWEKIIDFYANLKEDSKYGIWFRSYLRGILLLIDKENQGERINNQDLFSHSKWKEYITKMKPFTDKKNNNTENYKKMEEIKEKVELIIV